MSSQRLELHPPHQHEFSRLKKLIEIARFEIELGDSFGAILEECAAMDLPWPAEIADRLARREPWIDFYLGAYGDLSTCRGNGSYVPWLAIDRYAERMGMDADFAMHFIRCIRALDDVTVAITRARQGSKTGQQG